MLNGVGERRGEAFAQRKKMDELQLQRYARSYLLYQGMCSKQLCASSACISGHVLSDKEQN